MAKVEILLGTQNGAAHLGAQLASIAGQSLCDWTLLASDDGSTDATCAILDRFGAARPGAGFRRLTGPQNGTAANYLMLLQQADPTAAFVALADQDDIWFSDKLRRGVRHLQNVPSTRPALYAAQSILMDAAGNRISQRPSPTATPSFRNALVQNVCAGNTILLNRAAIDVAATYRPSCLPPFHDWWLYALMAGVGADIIVDPEPVLAYRQHGGGQLGAHAGMAARATRLKMVLDGTWRDWLGAHYAALNSVSDRLLPEHRETLRAFAAPQPRRTRIRLIGRSGIHRQGRSGTAALGLATLLGFV